MLTEKLKIRAVIFYEFKLDTKSSETHQKLIKVFGMDCISIRTIKNFYAKFRSGDFDLEDKQRSGRPSDLENDLLNQAISVDPTKTCAKLAEEFKSSEETIRRKLHQLGKVWRLSKWVPYELNESHKLNRLSTCSWLLSKHENEPFLDRIVTCDEKWIHLDNRKRSHAWLDPGSSSVSTPKPNNS